MTENREAFALCERNCCRENNWNHYTITNEKGEFVFNIPDAFSKDSLKISYLGYQSFTMLISQVTINKFVRLLFNQILQDGSKEKRKRQENIATYFLLKSYLLLRLTGMALGLLFIDKATNKLNSVMTFDLTQAAVEGIYIVRNPNKLPNLTIARQVS